MEKSYVVHTSLRDILFAIFKYNRLVITIFFTIVLLTTVFSFLLPRVYQASSKVIVKFGRENVYTPASPTMREGQPFLFDYSREERINSEVEILKGRNLVEKVISEIGVDKIYPNLNKKSFISISSSQDTEPIEKTGHLFTKATLLFIKNLQVEAVRKSNIIDIKYQHRDPYIAAKVVNKLIDVFLEFHLNVYKKSHGYEFFDTQVSILKAKLKESEDEYESFCRENNITSLDEQRSLLLQTSSSLKADLEKTRTEISEYEGKMHALIGHDSANMNEINMGEETDINPLAISSIKNRLNELRLEKEELLNKYKTTSVPVMNINKEIDKAQELLKREEKTYHDKAITSITHTLSALKKRDQVQTLQLDEYRKELDRINGLVLRLKGLERKVKLNEETYQLYVKHMEEARLSQAMDSQKIANISVVEPALPPIKPIKPRIMLNIALAVLLGMFFGILIPLYMEYLQHSFCNREDVQKYLDLPVLASIPEQET